MREREGGREKDRGGGGGKGKEGTRGREEGGREGLLCPPCAEGTEQLLRNCKGKSNYCFAGRRDPVVGRIRGCC